MSSIPDARPIVQVPSITTYRYALKLSPQQIQRLSRDELLTLCMEQYFLLWLIVAIIRNPLAAIATRIIAIDLIISFAEKTLRGTLKQITERSRVYISGDGGIAKRLGIHANTVSKAFNNLEKYRMIKRDYVYDEVKQREYLDITITSLQVEQPQKLQDKTMRNPATPKLKQSSPQGTTSSPLPTCPACGSGNIQIICRECGNVSSPEKTLAPVEELPSPTVIESTLLNKIYVVETNNAPLLREDSVDSDNNGNDDSATLSDIAQQPEPQPMQPISQGEDVDQVIISWLAKRIGHGKLIYATGSPEYSKKYYNKPPGYQPDYRAYMAGDRGHILGSYLSRPDGTTSVLAFDIDDAAHHAKHSLMLAELARAGAAPVYWQRQGERGHLELYFDRPVNPEQACSWCISVCPLLQEIVECYPAADKRNQPIAWPLYQRKLDRVFPCIAIASVANGERVEEVSAKDREGLARLVTTAITPASLIETYQMPPRKNDIATATKPTQQTTPAKQQAPGDLAKVVIAEFNAETSWEEVAALCGGFTRERKFKAVWRGERTPSVAIDADEEYACDYGRTGTAFPKKLDKYEVWCLAQGGREFKRFDLAQRTAAYRERQRQQEPEASPPPPEPQQQTRQETTPAPLPQEPLPDETGDEIVARLRGKRAVLTPLGRGKLWRGWPTEIGVVLDSDPGRVKFFRTLAEMRQVVSSDEEELLS